MILALDHVAVVVPDLTEALRRFTEDLGLPLAGTEDVATALTRTAFVPVAGPTALELVTPLPDALGRGQGLDHFDHFGIAWIDLVGLALFLAITSGRCSC